MRAVTVVLSMVLMSSASGVAGGVTPAKARRKAPAFVLSDANGSQVVRLSDYKGKVVVLDFWATWCTGCKLEIPWFMEFQDKYKSKGLETIGAAMDDEGWEKVRPYVGEHAGVVDKDAWEAEVRSVLEERPR